MKHYILSGLLHLSALIVLILPQGSSNKGNGNSDIQGYNVTVISPTTGAGEAATYTHGPGHKRKRSNKPCEHTYGGVGVQMAGDVVVDVYKGYPAFKAGIVLMDIIKTVDGEDLRGEVGSTVVVDLIRGSEPEQRISMVREAICYEP